MKVWVRKEDWHAWHKDNDLIVRPEPFCYECPLQWDDEKHTAESVFYLLEDDGHLYVNAVYVTQSCEHTKARRYPAERYVSDYIPVQFIELSEYDNFTGSEA